MDGDYGMNINDTSLDSDPFGELDEELYEEFRRYQIVWRIQMIINIIKILFCLIVVAGSIFLSVTILRFKRLQTRLNTYILNMSILTIFFYFIVPVTAILLDLIVGGHVFIVVMFTQNVLLILYLIFSLALALDWMCLSVGTTAIKIWIQRYQKCYKKVFCAVYVVLILLGIIVMLSTWHGRVVHVFYIFPIFYLICLITMIVLNILKRRMNKNNNNNQKTAYAMTVANIAIFSFIPIFFFYFMMYLVISPSHNFVMDIIVSLLEPIFVFASIGHPIWIVYYLGRSNKHFKMAYNKSLFRRSVRNYGDENLDDDVTEDDDGVNNDVNNSDDVENGGKVCRVNYTNENGLDENKQVLIV